MKAYGMSMRPRMPGAQPRDYKDWEDFDDRSTLPSGESVWSILWYTRDLTDEEIRGYELVRLENFDK